MYLTKNNKSKYYQVVYLVNGKRTTHSTKKETENEAKIYLIEFINSLNNPQPIEEEITINSEEDICLSKFQEEYISYISPTKSIKYRVSINFSFNQLISFAGDILLKNVNTKVVDKFIVSIFSRTKRGAHHCYRTLKAAFNKAVEWNYISENPFTKVKFPKLPKPYPVFITEDELLVILANTKFQHLKDIFTVAFYTGLRLGELINMQWNWIDFSQSAGGGQITVKCSDEFLTKSKKERIVPMCEKVKTILQNRFYKSIHRSDEVVFYRIKEKKLYNEAISKQFKKIVRAANLNEKIHFHTLRHSFASILVQRGVSLYVVKELLGHEDLSTTQIYSHLQKQNLMEAVNLL